jgi:hypothetical protein
VKKIGLCASNSQITQRMLSQITGVRIDLRLSETTRHHHVLAPPSGDLQTTLALINYDAPAAEAARDVFLHSLPALKAPLESATTLELRLDEPNTALYNNIGPFIRNNLHKLTDLYFDVLQSVSLSRNPAPSQPVTTAMYTLAAFVPSVTPADRITNSRRAHLGAAAAELRGRLRRLPISCTDGFRSVPRHVAHLPNLSELALSSFSSGPVRLHPENKGLKRLHLSHLETSAEHLIGMITKAPATAANDDAAFCSPLVELVLSHVNLDVVAGVDDVVGG